MKKSKKIHRHVGHHLLLFLLLTTAFFAFTVCQSYPDKQFKIGIVGGLTYFLWGIYHHLQDDDLNWKIVVEYGVISMFGVAMIWLLLSYVH